MEALRDIERQIIEADAELKVENSGASQTSNAPRIPIEINQNVQKWIAFFTIKDRERFQTFLDRGLIYRDLIKGILREHGVPTELYYLAMIESGFVLHARSHASAVGAWQFIRGTGVRYGLMQNYYVDERRDIIHSTHAAAEYLRNLHIAFQSWYLAMAGYNAGEGRILGAILRGGTRDFWELVEKKSLPPETRNYVPKFLAAAIIGRHPEKFGFRVNEPEKYPSVESVRVPGGVRLNEVAKRIGVPSRTLSSLNPHLLRKMTPANLATYPIWVPKGAAERTAELRPVFAKLRIRSERAVATSGKKYHRVRRGETLSVIARKYSLSVLQLKRLNGLRSSRIYVGSRLVVAGSSKSAQYHRVRRGDALTLIARRYGVSVGQLKRLNRLGSNRIYVGQRLRVRSSGI